jgi:hypothetical protein
MHKPLMLLASCENFEMFISIYKNWPNDAYVGAHESMK